MVFFCFGVVKNRLEGCYLLDRCGMFFCFLSSIMDRVDINYDCVMILCKFFKDIVISMDRIKVCKEVVVISEKVFFFIRRSNLLMNTFDDFTSTVFFEDIFFVFLTKYMKREDRYFRFMFIDNYTAANRKVFFYDCLFNLYVLVRNFGN